jgi:hypothetical protein
MQHNATPSSLLVLQRPIETTRLTRPWLIGLELSLCCKVRPPDVLTVTGIQSDEGHFNSVLRRHVRCLGMGGEPFHYFAR